MKTGIQELDHIKSFSQVILSKNHYMRTVEVLTHNFYSIYQLTNRLIFIFSDNVYLAEDEESLSNIC